MKQLHWYNRLFYIIFFWILILSITPLLVVSFISYESSVSQMKSSAIAELAHTAGSYKEFINNWFGFRVKDITAQSEESVSIARISVLKHGYKKFNKDSKKYIHSFSYLDLTAGFDEKYRNIINS